MKSQKFSLLLNPFFLLSLILLGLNDHILKELYPSLLTGKLSDFSGLIVLQVILYLLLKQKRYKKNFTLAFSTAVTGLFFTLLQFNLSLRFFKNVIESVLGYAPNLVADKTDLLALVILPFSYIFFLKNEQKENEFNHPTCFRKLQPSVFLVALCTLVATSFVGTSQKLLKRNLVESNKKGEFLFRLEEEFISNGFEITNRAIKGDSVYLIGTDFNYQFKDSTISYPFKQRIYTRLKFILKTNTDSLQLVDVYMMSSNFSIDSTRKNMIVKELLKPINRAISELP